MWFANVITSSTVGPLKQTDCISAVHLLPSMRKCFGYRRMGIHLSLLEPKAFAGGETEAT